MVDLKIGAKIQKSQVFRLKPEDFQPVDSPNFSAHLQQTSKADIDEFRQQVLLKKRLQTVNKKIYDTERIIVQEKGEKFCAEKSAVKKTHWTN